MEPLVLRPTASQKAAWMWVITAVVYLAIAVFGYFIRGGFVWTFGAYTVFFAASGVMHYFAARRARVELHETGVRAAAEATNRGGLSTKGPGGRA